VIAPADGHRRLTLRPEGPAGSDRVGGLVPWSATRLEPPRVHAWTTEEVDQLRWSLRTALLRDADGDADAFAERHAAALARFTAVREQAASARDDVLGRPCVVTGELRRLVATVG
jgi:hypothetical protein